MKLSLLDRTRGENPVTAITLLMSGVMILACQDSLVKLMSSDTSFWQFQTLRSIGNILLVVLIALAGNRLLMLRPLNAGVVYLRGAMLTLCMFCFFAGAPYLTLDQMAAGLYTYPIFVSLLAGPVLKEPVGLWRTGAIILGAMGAVLVLSPWRAGFSNVQLLPLAAGFFYACNVLTLRKLCRDESPLALALAVAVLFICSGVTGITVLSLFPAPQEIQESIPFVAVGWPELTWVIVGFAALTSILNLSGNICMTRAYQTADASLLAPLDFSYLLFAAIWGKLMFDTWPENQALAGMSLIAVAGMITAWRERRKVR